MPKRNKVSHQEAFCKTLSNFRIKIILIPHELKMFRQKNIISLIIFKVKFRFKTFNCDLKQYYYEQFM